MGLLSWFGEKLAGVDTAAQEKELAAMETKLAEAKALEETGIAPAAAAAQAGIGAGQAGGMGTSGESWGITKVAFAPSNFLANFGASLGSAMNMQGVGSADPGSLAANTEDILATAKKNLPSFSMGLLKYGLLAAAVIFALAFAANKAKGVASV